MMTEASCLLIGRLGRDAETKTTANGVQLVRLAVATDHKAAGGGRETDWWDVTCWRPADWMKKLRKGEAVAVKASIQWREYETKDGERKRVLDVHAMRVIALGAQQGQGNSEGVQNHDDDPAANYEPAAEYDPAADNDLPF